MEPGANPPVDIFPILRYIPERFAFWKRRALDAGKTMDDAWRGARERVEARRAKGIKRDSIIDSCLDEYEKKGMPFSQHGFDNLMGEILEGAADTTASQLCTLIMAFTVYPDVQVKARQEIDRVCGSGRAPGWSDFQDLPYINAIIKEGMRWRPTYVIFCGPLNVLADID
jgi:cytochrome P450